MDRDVHVARERVVKELREAMLHLDRFSVKFLGLLDDKERDRAACAIVAQEVRRGDIIQAGQEVPASTRPAPGQGWARAEKGLSPGVQQETTASRRAGTIRPQEGALPSAEGRSPIAGGGVALTQQRFTSARDRRRSGRHLV